MRLCTKRLCLNDGGEAYSRARCTLPVLSLPVSILYYMKFNEKKPDDSARFFLMCSTSLSLSFNTVATTGSNESCSETFSIYLTNTFFWYSIVPDSARARLRFKSSRSLTSSFSLIRMLRCFNSVSRRSFCRRLMWVRCSPEIPPGVPTLSKFGLLLLLLLGVLGVGGGLLTASDADDEPSDDAPAEALESNRDCNALRLWISSFSWPFNLSCSLRKAAISLAFCALTSSRTLSA
mmetsp:Transcript_6661/g.13209  ORF Transcript_6661/g.13209 Transcript_6661/m.13209 type:complete len:235 (+) Transcript_6661:83-787(+)